MRKYLWLLVLVIVAVPIVRLVLLPVFAANKAVSSAEGIIDRTLDADNVIYNYEWFKQRYEDALATRTKIENAKAAVAAFKEAAGPRSDWTFEDKTESARLASVVLGLENHYESIVAEYNARAQMAHRDIFRRGVPKRIG